MPDDPALVTLRRYFTALEAFDIDAAIACFTPDAVYAHPPYGDVYDNVDEGDGTSGAHVVRGHDGLRELFALRGEQPSTHHVSQFIRSGSTCFNEGYMLDGSGTLACTWLAVFEVDDQDRISRYIPYASVPPLPLLRAIGRRADAAGF